MKYLSTTLVFFSLLLTSSQAQDKNPLINSAEIIRLASELYDSGQYKMSIELFNQIDRNDTNYVWALYEKALACGADSQFTRAIALCREGLSLTDQREHEPELYVELGNMLDANGQKEEALSLFDSALEKYPAFSLLYFNKGVVLSELERYSQAEDVYKRCLLIDPYMYSAHFNLGIVALNEGKIIPAFLSFMGYLMMSPEGKYSARSIQLMDLIAKSKDEILTYKNNRKEGAGESYATIEEIVLSGIALDKNYKPIIQLDDPISRQMQVLLEKAEFNANDSDFWVQYYLPHFKSIYKNGQFELFVNRLFSSVNIPSIQTFVKRNKKELELHVNEIVAYYNLLRATRELHYDKREATITRYLFRNGELQGFGKLANDGNALTGPWVFSFPAGNLRARGLFNEAGEREGDWTYYFFNGKLKAKEHFVKGKLEGKQVYYFDNGLESSIENYADGKADGVTKVYYRVGTEKSVANYRMGDFDGEKRDYYPNGAIHIIQQYSKGALDGAYSTFYQNGSLNETTSFKQNALDGNYKSYFENAKLSSEGIYNNGKAEGEWIDYFENGKIKEKRSFVKGEVEGELEDYFDNGQLFVKYQYKKGKINGETTYYSKEGKLYSILIFDNNNLKSAKYFDPSGKMIGSSEMQDRKLELTTFNQDGSMKSKVTYSDKGQVLGTETTFYSAGSVKETQEYKDGELSGMSISYYPNGKKKVEVKLENGKKNGYYRDYFQDGTLQNEGWYVQDEAQGKWMQYDEHGHLANSSNYLDGVLSGYKEVYFPDGRKLLEEKYSGGWLEEVRQFDTLGKEIARDYFPGGTGRLRLLYPGGRIRAEQNYYRGFFDGVNTSYYFDGSIQNVEYYKRGLEDSVYHNYYYGGVLSSEGRFRSGKRNGKWNYYYPDGAISSSYDFTDGDLDGKRIYYAKNGKIDLEANFKAGLRDGITVKLNPNGSPIYLIRYEDGVPVAYSFPGNGNQDVPEIGISLQGTKFKTFFPNGQVSRECEYLNGNLNGKDILYYPNGKIHSLYSNENGDFEGEMKTYFENGKPETEYLYHLDNMDGPYREYNENGVLTEEGNYYNGNYHGIVKRYDANGKIKETRKYYYGYLLAITK